MVNLLTPYRLVSAATDNATSVKATRGRVGYIIASNVNAAVRYLHLYDRATAPTLGTHTPVLTVPLPGATVGTAVVLSVPETIEFATGIAFAITTTTGTIPASGAVAANEISVSIGYR